MVCPVCGASCKAAESYCRRCGADVTIPSTTVVPAKPTLPAVPERASRALATSARAGAGIVALGVGYEVLRWGLKFWLRRPARAVSTLSALPTLANLLNAHSGTEGRLRKGYQVTETMIYMKRVIGPKD
ncbi:MAG TPA: hypothetical protein VF099_15435 [Ktedonobacterales bacterium]